MHLFIVFVAAILSSAIAGVAPVVRRQNGGVYRPILQQVGSAPHEQHKSFNLF